MKLEGFAPVGDQDTHTLILGSFPGVASLEATQYYAHPRNQFWRLVGAAIGEPLHEMAYDDRLKRLVANGIGLWDVIAEAQRQGSLDSAIRNHSANDLHALVSGFPQLHTIAFNGGTAAKIGEKALGDLARLYRIVRLPSSSAAYAAMPYSDKLAAWTLLRPTQNQ
jgi:hypoxanthine-DNA glycosylase